MNSRRVASTTPFAITSQMQPFTEIMAYINVSPPPAPLSSSKTRPDSSPFLQFTIFLFNSFSNFNMSNNRTTNPAPGWTPDASNQYQMVPYGNS